ncbi:acyltransferase family protein [Rhizobium sp. AAP43]|uniref:acyltransferase family protein n=1 Tax=Rhizobium sp. AAP43 TaxID=1523420 RepID=UPI0006B92192|nr:acyltransferase family protein [Rhizobium sp. AAP43]
MTTSTMRNDITGLRAIAVLSVLFYHVGAPVFPGGFVGVDVFLVISGYLITLKIRNEIERTGRFDLSAFYTGRVRRLFPALLATVTGSSIVACLIFPPSLFQELAGSAVAAVLSFSNFFFYGESGYFDTSTRLKPLLHTWSLSMEEQFYLVWPVAMIFLMKVRGGGVRLAVIAALLSASLLLSIAKMADQAMIYYLLPFRAFELLIGALLALTERKSGADKAFGSWIGLLAGLACIIWPVLFYSKETVFPTYNAVLPCLGAALVIFSGQCKAGRIIIGNRPMVYCGLISYSLYLVHWPAIVFWEYASGSSPTLWGQAAICAISVALASASYHLVETPFRHSKAISSRMAMSACFVGASLVIAPAVVVWSGDGWPWRFPGAAMTLIDPTRFDEGVTHYPRDCFALPTQKPDEKDPACFTAANNGKKNVLLLGDSTANHLAAGLHTLLAEEANVLIWASSVCPPVRGVAAKDNPNCRSNMDQFFDEILPANHYDLVIAASFQELDAMRAGFGETLETFRRVGTPVVLVGRPLLYRANPSDIIAQNLRSDDFGTLLASRLRIGCDGEDGLDQLVAPDRFFSMKSHLCSNGLPIYQVGGTLINADVLHLNGRGSLMIARNLIAWLRQHTLL